MGAAPFFCRAGELPRRLNSRPGSVRLDPRNEKDHANLYIEAPTLLPCFNIPCGDYLKKQGKILFPRERSAKTTSPFTSHRRKI